MLSAEEIQQDTEVQNYFGVSTLIFPLSSTRVTELCLQNRAPQRGQLRSMARTLIRKRLGLNHFRTSRQYIWGHRCLDAYHSGQAKRAKWLDEDRFHLNLIHCGVCGRYGIVSSRGSWEQVSLGEVASYWPSIKHEMVGTPPANNPAGT